VERSVVVAEKVKWRWPEELWRGLCRAGCGGLREVIAGAQWMAMHVSRYARIGRKAKRKERKVLDARAEVFFFCIHALIFGLLLTAHLLGFTHRL
jgi:hypothetical protein